ncbi:hypothetical protein LSH36_509g01014 [Paralvinella palmiformis]|uniref:Uncharacterized protein n=1 Tax=Paralvinella palmiformis TaxID=53620 RepID=A0AAD9J834_9ANNE|nr:hypothetical protein LSH36_509g01014 [Paralvinella palmiformis]
MLEELRFAVRCHGSTKKPALKRQCSKCLHHPDEPCTVDSPNGIIQLKDMREMHKSPIGNLNNRETHFKYYEPSDTYTDYRDAVSTHVHTHA